MPRGSGGAGFIAAGGNGGNIQSVYFMKKLLTEYKDAIEMCIVCCIFLFFVGEVLYS